MASPVSSILGDLSEASDSSIFSASSDDDISSSMPPPPPPRPPRSRPSSSSSSSGSIASSGRVRTRPRGRISSEPLSSSDRVPPRPRGSTVPPELIAEAKNVAELAGGGVDDDGIWREPTNLYCGLREPPEGMIYGTRLACLRRGYGAASGH